MEELKDIKDGTSPRSKGEAHQPGQQDQNGGWILVAMAIDRLFLVIYMVLTIVLVVTLFLNHPYVKG